MRIDNRTPIECTPALVEECLQMVSRTQFGNVRRYINQPESPVRVVMLLNEEYRLEELVAHFVERSGFEAEMLYALVGTGALRFGVDFVPDASDGCVRVPLGQIPDDYPCNAICVLPAFFVQLRSN